MPKKARIANEVGQTILQHTVDKKADVAVPEKSDDFTDRLLGLSLMTKILLGLALLILVMVLMFVFFKITFYVLAAIIGLVPIILVVFTPSRS